MRAVLLVLVATPAWATGICENTPRNYGSPTLVAGDVFAVPGTQAWCEDIDGRARRGVVSFVELRDPGGVKTTLATSAKHLPDAEVVPSIPAALAARGFKPLAASRTCKVHRQWGRSVEIDRGWPARMLALEIGTKTDVVATEIDLVPRQRQRAVRVVLHFAKPDVLVYVRRPTCSGPPPGYFGKDDPGACYAEDEVIVQKHAVPQCF